MNSLLRRAVLALPLLAFGPAAQAQTAPAAADAVVARVDGSEIRRSDIAAAIELLPQQYRQLPPEMLFNGVLAQIIDRRLMAQAAEKEQLADSAEVKHRLAALREHVLQDAWVSRAVEKGVSEASLRARHAEQVKALPVKEEVKARHVLVQSEADARAATEEIRKGADFAEVAKKRSAGPSAANGGDLGWFARDQMVPEFAEAAFALKPGEITAAPVKSQFGWHVIKVEDRRAAPPPSFEERREALQQEAAQEVVAALTAELRAKAKIERVEGAGAN